MLALLGAHHILHVSRIRLKRRIKSHCHFLALLGPHHILHVSRMRVNVVSPYRLKHFLIVIAEPRYRAISFVMSVSVRPYGTTGFPLNTFSRNLIFQCFFQKSIEKVKVLLRSDKNNVYSACKVADRSSTVIKMLCYKSEGRWFDPQLVSMDFSLT